MIASFLQEPELEFGAGTHVDIRFGLMNYGPLDFQSRLKPSRIRLGIIGTPETTEGLCGWINKLRSGVTQKPSKRPNLFPRFPGFGQDQVLSTDIVIDYQLIREIPPAQFERLFKGPRDQQTYSAIAELYLDQIQYLEEKKATDVVLCAYPENLVDFLDQNESGGSASAESGREDGRRRSSPAKCDLHDLLKARAMRFGIPLQVIRPGTYGSGKRKADARGRGEKKLQDEATRAWNFYVALYYKAGGTPWRLVRDSSSLTSCYIGVSFYKSLEETSLLTSTAQVFNERGDGIILRGGRAHISKEDKTVHLETADAHALLMSALQYYRREHGNFPARVVIHKSSIHNQEELDGFDKALTDLSIDPMLSDFLSLTKSSMRLFRSNRYPPLRGTLWDIGGNVSVLYTRGSVGFFEAYPGMYVPRPLLFRRDRAVQTSRFLASEMLALSKMNWNNTQFDGDEPVTLLAARQVGTILRYCSDDSQASYRYYM